jgi:tRNA(Ile2) C34 agmatinyltransferase TiaS
MLIRFISPLAGVGAIIWAIAAEPTPSTAERLANVPVATDMVCPFCGGSLSPGDWRCVNCGVRRR